MRDHGTSVYISPDTLQTEPPDSYALAGSGLGTYHAIQTISQQLDYFMMPHGTADAVHASDRDAMRRKGEIL